MANESTLGWKRPAFASPLVTFSDRVRLLQRSAATRIWLLPRFSGQKDKAGRADLLKGFWERLATCVSTTPEGRPLENQRLANDISRQLVGIPFTRTEQDEIRAQKNGLAPQEIDRNAYRQSTRRSYAPRDTRKHRPGWVTYQFILPKRLVEGLTLLTKMKVEQQAAERAQI